MRRSQKKPSGIGMKCRSATLGDAPPPGGVGHLPLTRSRDRRWGESQKCVRRREDHFVSSMDSDKERWRPKQLEGVPAWDELRPQLISFCERSRSALEAELGRHPKGNHNWEIVSGAIEYCAEVIPVLENAQDWETAWAGNSDMPTGVRTWRRLSKWYRGIGRSTMSNYVTLGIQTGQIRELDVPGDLPLVKSGL